ncbi:MAG TPA: tail fiber protein [Verrucomicrobiae bacterium]|nr:tail fiber protein [Verrucomicrobiae bacterium]
MFGFNFTPEGWAMCNGQLLPIEQNQALFALIGTYYGGNGTTNFALPNLQSRVPIHQGTGIGLSPYEIGELTGTETVTLTINQIPAHTHPVGCSSGGGTVASPANAYPAVESTGTSLDYSSSTNATMNPLMNGGAGGSQSHTNIQPVLCVNFCIALQGIFPTRS